MEECEPYSQYICNALVILRCIFNLPFGVIAMREDIPGTVMTSNNIGLLKTTSHETVDNICKVLIELLKRMAQ